MSLDMWTKPWNMKEGFLIGGGLIIAGLALQLSVGLVGGMRLPGLPMALCYQDSLCC